MADVLLILIIFGGFFGYLALSDYLDAKLKQSQYEYETKLAELYNNKTMEKILQILEEIEETIGEIKKELKK